jgi:hypothetical protein
LILYRHENQSVSAFLVDSRFYLSLLIDLNPCFSPFQMIPVMVGCRWRFSFLSLFPRVLLSLVRGLTPWSPPGCPVPSLQHSGFRWYLKFYTSNSTDYIERQRDGMDEEDRTRPAHEKFFSSSLHT